VHILLYLQMKEFIEHMTNMKDGKLQLSVLKCFMKAPSSCLLDKITGAEFLSTLINKVK